MTNHVCSTLCFFAEGAPETNWTGHLTYCKTHKEGNLTWFEDVFIGPRAVYIERDKIGEYLVHYAAPGLSPRGEGPYATDEIAWETRKEFGEE